LSSDAQGALFGLHLGYNHQFDNRWVVGLEGSVDGTDLSKHSILGVSNNAIFGNGCFNLTFACFNYGYGASVDTKISSDVQGALRGRLGYAWNRLLFYGAGGVALANFNHQSNLSGAMPDSNPANWFTNPDSIFYYAAGRDSSSLRLGWTLGGGLEYAINSNWSVRADYRYTDFGRIVEQPIANSDGGEWFSGNRHIAQNQLQVGFSYRFAEPDPEPAPGLIVKGPAVGASLSSPASAPLKGPVPPAPVIPVAIDWTGFYAGGQAGYAYGDNHGAYSYEIPGFNGVLNPSGALIGEAQGVIFGAHAGYNLEIDKWVVGLEGAVDGTSLNRRNTFGVQDPAINNGAGALHTFIQSEIQGALRGRAGYAFGRFLPYFAGGVAIGEFSFQSQLAGLDLDAAGNQLFSYATKGLQSTTRFGWTAGGGAEWAVNNHWSVRGEYRFSDFGKYLDTPTTTAILGAWYGGQRHLDQNQVQFGFSYKFGEPAVPTALVTKY
jgi:opacity protein-like surface antigen